jgi:hypothetical protein
MGVVYKFVPPASAAEQSPLKIARQARSIATVDAEHAVSIVIPGPVHPKK